MSRPVVTITYCTRCRWMLRAQWYCGELLQTFEEVLGGVTLVPAQGGVFRVDVDGTAVWNRKRDGGFPEVTELKRRVRDLVAPGMALGHVDAAAARAGAPGGTGPEPPAGPAARSAPGPA
ncbi:SelT/SelW/SelH family protein [Cellulomonas endophytica]|uniref:SelT/SelW/SelH family protein n=1 Tax=Cellulomonas endophytica TaxID=2494735 RepID=UPI0010109DF3|nr:SelT/SelW/SelH family protein [Cellulomonas endophytica]